MKYFYQVLIRCVITNPAVHGANEGALTGPSIEAVHVWTLKLMEHFFYLRDR